MCVRGLHHDRQHDGYRDEEHRREEPRIGDSPSRRSNLRLDGCAHVASVLARKPAASRPNPPTITRYRPTPTCADTSPAGMPNCTWMSRAFDPASTMWTMAMTIVT